MGITNTTSNIGSFSSLIPMQTPEEVDKAWQALYEHLESCEDCGMSGINKENFIEFGKQQFIIIPIR